MGSFKRLEPYWPVFKLVLVQLDLPGKNDYTALISTHSSKIVISNGLLGIDKFAFQLSQLSKTTIVLKILDITGGS